MEGQQVIVKARWSQKPCRYEYVRGIYRNGKFLFLDRDVPIPHARYWRPLIPEES